MKKLLATILSATLLLSAASVTVFAEDEHQEALDFKKYEVFCKADFDTLGCNPAEDTSFYDPDTVVAVNVTWSDTDFKYDFGNKWDPETHCYVEQPGWDKDFIDVTITNHSNCPVGAELEITEIYTPKTNVYFDNDLNTANLTSAIDAENVANGNNSACFTIKFEYTPESFVNEYESFFTFEVKISGNTFSEPETPAVEEETGEHEHHYVYDQFGRLVCTGCDSVKHEMCIDLDEDGICDECGLERDFCPDCHVGGRCVCT